MARNPERHRRCKSACLSALARLHFVDGHSAPSAQQIRKEANGSRRDGNHDRSGGDEEPFSESRVTRALSALVEGGAVETIERSAGLRYRLVAAREFSPFYAGEAEGGNTARGNGAAAGPDSLRRAFTDGFVAGWLAAGDNASGEPLDAAPRGRAKRARALASDYAAASEDGDCVYCLDDEAPGGRRFCARCDPGLGLAAGTAATTEDQQ